MKRFLLFILFLMVIALGTSWVTLRVGMDRDDLDTGQPWHIDILAEGGARVFAIELGVTPLRQAVAAWRRSPRLGLFIDPSGHHSLEAYFGRLPLGMTEAHLTTILAATESMLHDFAIHAVASEPVPSGARRLDLREADDETALTLPIAEINVIPTAPLSAEFLSARFGPPADRLPTGQGQATYWLYPALGLVILHDGADDAAVLHYLAPRDFPRLRARLAQEIADRGRDD